MNVLWLSVLCVSITLATARSNDVWSRIRDKVQDKVKDVEDKVEDVLQGDPGSFLDVPEHGNGAPAKPCCFPAQYQGKAAMVSDVGFRFKGMFTSGTFIPRFAMDHKKQVFAMDEVMRTPFGSKNISTIIDLKAMVTYFVMKEKKFCKKFKIPAKGGVYDGCINKASRHMGPGYLGAPPASLKVDAWVLHKDDIRVLSSVTSKGCVPVSEMIVGKMKGHHFTSHISYMDIVTKISDPSIFTIPSFCKKADTVDFEEMTDMAKGLMDHFTL